MAVHRKRKPREPRTVSRVTQTSVLNIPGDSGSGDEYLRKAAKVISDGAKGMAGTWSVKIPPSMYITISGTVATIHAAAPDARPAEFRLRHPLYGNRDHWYGPPGEPFLAPALDARIDDALRAYAEKITPMARKLGWK